MCLYPTLIKNRKYLPNKKNNFKPPICEDQRLLYVTAACGKCLECRKQKARAWQVRMVQEQKSSNNGIFVTLTFSDESMNELKTKYKITDDNEIATKATRLFLERIRKEKKRSIKHWLITEKGHNNTERLHLHGIIWDDKATYYTERYWKYGHIFIGSYVNEKTITYVVKYMTKPDYEHKDFIGKVLCSAGIGKDYIETINAKNNEYRGKDTNTTYRLPNGAKINLPTYYKNKLYTEEEREELWKAKLDEGKVYVMGEECNIDDQESYTKLLQYHQARAKQIMRYDEIQWEKEKYKKRLQRQRRDIHK